MKGPRILFIACIAIAAFAFCYRYIFASASSSPGNSSSAENIFSPETPEEKDPVKILLDTSLADGFDFPVGNKEGKGSYKSADGKQYDGWYIAVKCAEEYSLGIHTGEDWNGSGGGDTDLGQPVYSAAGGEVVHAAECPSPWGNVIMIKHKYFENGKIKTVYSQYSHLKDIDVKKGQFVLRRQKIGSIGQGNYKEYPAHLHFEIRSEKMKDYAVDYWPSSNDKSVAWVKEHYIDPSSFIKAHRKIVVPAKEKIIVLSVKHRLKSYVYKSGKLHKTYEIALGQAPRGHKEKQGDLKTPEGAYSVCEKTVGPFPSEGDNWAQAYLGTRWIRLNYPNAFDAEEGLKKKLVTKDECDKIKKAIAEKRMPPKGTALGGGIGIHGWIEPEWSDTDTERTLTWGCISMHKKDLEEFYDIVQLNTIVVVMP